MTALAEALRQLVDSQEVPGLVAAVGRGDDIEVVVLGDQALEGRRWHMNRCSASHRSPNR